MAPVSSTSLVLAGPDRLACRGWIRAHSRSFYLSSLLLPARVREASWALYAFCRRADDAVDESVDGEEAADPDTRARNALGRVEALRRRLDHVYRGEAVDHPIDRAFAVVIERHAIPRALPEALLAGMEMDARGVSYDTHEELLRYCFRVASTVGLMMTRVMGHAAPVALLRAADLGVAMQLTNICRDVGEDARRGRVYLPRELCQEVGLDPAALASASVAPPAAREAVRRLLARADAHYRAADLGVPLLPRSCRLAIASSRRIYAAIGDALGRRGYDSVSGRAYVSLPGKIARVLRALPAILGGPGPRSLQSIGPADAILGPLLVEVGLSAPGAPR